ncbi:MAG: hypothetical protein GXY80_15325 [Syntrophorhabdus aromaticivorans]|uniref:Uncharacterized protein n=1 Tax=Syntrophorhabdus aromaticivorans TaxID=328301 RepID=A0A971S316_9BACT|nr:hypothetical protein [Syntrophorhabdus aromaticivorans]
MTLEKKLKALLNEVLAETERNPAFRERLSRLLEDQPLASTRASKRSARRQPGKFDPMAVYRDHPQELTARLEALTVDELKDMVAEGGMDRTKLAMKWKDKERLVELIVNTVKSRDQKGDAFRAPIGRQPTDAQAKDNGSTPPEGA